MKAFFHHLFLPKESNNHRARALHPIGIFVISFVLLVSSLFIQIAQTNYSGVLGITTNINIDQLVGLTNKEREANGLEDLIYSKTLSNAASEKAKDMFAQDYWAHNSPNGTTPWVFIKAAGYDYLYAGENLARGFTESGDVVQAWMDSPGHRENILSKNYKEVGFAVSEGRLAGTETTLVVQMFGSPRTVESQREITDVVDQDLNKSQASQPSNEPPSSNGQTEVASVQTTPIINSSNLVKNVSLLVVSTIILLLILDLVIIKRKKIYRVVSHNVDTVIFLTLIVIIIIMIGRGSIL